MKKVMVANPKGGVGKTTLADGIAFAFEKRGFNVAFSELDATQAGNLHSTTFANGDEDIQVIDTPGREEDQMKDWLKMIDAMVIPATPSMLDLFPTQQLYERASQALGKDKVGVVVNRWHNPAHRIDRQFLRFFTNAEINVWGIVNDTTVIKNAQANKENFFVAAKTNPAIEAIDEIAQKILVALQIYEQTERIA